MAHFTRRDFLKTGAAITALSSTGGLALAKHKRAATDWVTLGKSKVKVTRLAFGTGTTSGRAQRELGQEGFTRLVRHAYDQGIRFFETAESYHGMPEMLAIALKGLPRDSYRLMTKYSTPATGDPAPKIDQFRQQLNTEYIDILLLHCLRPPTWVTDYESLRDGFSLAQQKKMIVTHGASIHGLPALRTIPGNKWLEVAMIRMNHNGTRMDTPDQRDVDKIGRCERSGGAHQGGTQAGHGRDQHEAGGRRAVHQSGRSRRGDEVCHEFRRGRLGDDRVHEHGGDR